MTPEHPLVRNEIVAILACRPIGGLLIRFVAPAIIACLIAASSAAQTAREVRGAAAVEPLQNEPPAKIIIDPPLPEPLSRGLVVIQYRTENLHIVPVFGPAALAVSPRVGHIHVTVDDARWVWADASGEPVVLNGLPPGPHTIRLELETANHQRLDQGAVFRARCPLPAQFCACFCRSPETTGCSQFPQQSLSLSCPLAAPAVDGKGISCAWPARRHPA